MSGGARTIKTVAIRAQYASLQAFDKAFQEAFGCTPSQFRERNQGSVHFLPGYLAALGQPIPAPNYEVGVVVHSYVVTYSYSNGELVLQSTTYPDGRVETRN